MANSLPDGLTDCLLWAEELGMGWHPRAPMQYDGSYFENYRRLDATEMGEALTQVRVDMVRRHHQGEVLDVGIGGGRFVTECGAIGFDVNPEAVKWLEEQGLFRDPPQAAALTFWDALEHIPSPARALEGAAEWVFVSMPIYLDSADALASKHFKPGEHLWYWTKDGLIRWFHRHGFACMEVNQAESDLGREGIMSFAFKRID